MMSSSSVRSGVNGLANLPAGLERLEKLYLRGYYPADEIRKGPVGVQVTVNGVMLREARIASGGDFELAYPLPDALVGQAAIDVVVEVSRTFHAGADVRDLGLSFGEFEVK